MNAVRIMAAIGVYALMITGAADAKVNKPAMLIERRGTELAQNGKPFHELSFNKFDLLWQFVFDYDKPNGRQAALESLDWLRDNGFRVIRVSCCPYGADGFNEVFFDSDPRKQSRKRESYFRRFDEMLHECELRDIQVVATLVWNLAVLDDLGTNTFVEGLTDRAAEGRQKVDDYVREVVKRYAGRKGIAIWEIGNEWNLMSDLRPEDKPGWDFNAGQLGAFYKETASLIKSIDPWRLVTTGDSSPRQSAWHMYRSSTLKAKQIDWTHDSEEQLAKYLKMVNPDPVDVISIHYYDEAMGALGREIGNVENIGLYKRLADRIGKPLFIGEVGPHHGFKDARYTDPRNIDLCRRVIGKIADCSVPITLFWAFRDDRAVFDGIVRDYDLRPGSTEEALRLIAEGQSTLTAQ